MDLNRLKDRAGEIYSHRESEWQKKKRKRPRFSFRRIMVWFIELILLAFAVEHFIWKPWSIKRKTANEVVQLPHGAPAPVLGANALKIPHLKEVRGSFLPDVSVLAPGAVSAQAAQVDVSKEKKLPIEVVNSIGMRFRLIPNGTFLMGSPESEFGRGKGEVRHVREIASPFYLGKWEVTQAQWQAVMGEGNNPSGFVSSRRPVEEVQWYDCQRFLIALCEKESVPRWTYRLPSEASWEYACRAGSLTAYHFGQSPARLKEFDFYNGSSFGRTQPCGLKLPNAFGLYDMHGNVWEWCRDVYKNYPGCDLPDPTGGRWRVIRGGNFHVEAADCRSAERARLPPASHGNILGFRVMRVIPELYQTDETVEIPSLSPEESILKPEPEPLPEVVE